MNKAMHMLVYTDVCVCPLGVCPQLVFFKLGGRMALVNIVHILSGQP